MLSHEFVFMILGTLIGVFSHIAYVSVFGKSKVKKAIRQRVANAHGRDDGNEEAEDDWEDDESSEDESGYTRNKGPAQIDDNELFNKHPISNVKMVLVVREDLKMGKGKIGA